MKGNPTRNAAAFVSGVLTLVACAGSAGSAGSASLVATPSAHPPACETGFAPPAGFEPFETFEEPYSDRVGVRLGFRDEGGREIHVFAGIPGEFGEGLPDAGSVDLTGGAAGQLFGSGRVWVLVWREGGECDPRAALGNGLEQKEFLGALVEAGIVTATV